MFTGLRMDVPEVLDEVSVSVLPSLSEGLSNVLLESMACETPVVCSDILGFRDVVVNEREALMVPCGDRDALADAQSFEGRAKLLAQNGEAAQADVVKASSQVAVLEQAVKAAATSKPADAKGGATSAATATPTDTKNTASASPVPADRETMGQP